MAIIDPVYLCLPYDINPANLFDIGRMLRNVSDVCRDAGATPILVHHLKKGIANPYVPGQLEDIGWAGFQEFFRQWMLINRREPYEVGSGLHRLWFSTGGSAGHSSLLGLDIFEGIYDPSGASPRVWDVTTLKPHEVNRASEDRREEAKEAKAEFRVRTRLDRNRRKIIDVMVGQPNGHTLSSLADQARMSRQRASEAIESRVEDGQLIACKVVKGKNKRELDGYQLANDDDGEFNPDRLTRIACPSGSNVKKKLAH
ncbi:hypothetical protein CA54_21890 [Symmachiella macrocystis]|uniref:Uncharacterized protein n=1 Tax=Symmachiella macrocystis TaxID=2527985 RepID=A0A5C6BRP4_9PLAN|nr:hypothetical protein CA54_21890 [Symmachiella macrocystis]